MVTELVAGTPRGTSGSGGDRRRITLYHWAFRYHGHRRLRDHNGGRRCGEAVGPDQVERQGRRQETGRESQRSNLAVRRGIRIGAVVVLGGIVIAEVGCLRAGHSHPLLVARALFIDPRGRWTNSAATNCPVASANPMRLSMNPCPAASGQPRMACRGARAHRRQWGNPYVSSPFRPTVGFIADMRHTLGVGRRVRGSTRARTRPLR